MNCSATLIPKRNPEHAAARSKAQQAVAPRSRWMKAAVEGSGMSGEIVEQIIRSRSLGEMPAMSSALRAAFTESLEVVSVKAARKRSEEHTSELQSLAYLVCRLLLEK